MILDALQETLSVCRLGPQDGLPEWAMRGAFFSVTRTADELSVVCVQGVVPKDVRAERDWRCFKVRGPLDFGLTGILSSLATTLADARVSLFAISTFDTDYLLVRSPAFETAVRVLRVAGHEINEA